MEVRNSDFYLQSEHTGGSNAAPSIGIMDILGTLRRGWRFPVFGCLIGVTLAVSYIVSTPNLYKSSARILLDRSVNRYLQTHKIIDEPTFDDAEIGSQVHILSSESIVIPVVRSMNLAQDSEFVGPPKEGGAQIMGYVERLKEFVKRTIDWGDSAHAKRGAIDADAALERTAVENFFKRLTVYREDVANVINVTFASEDANKAANIANEIADTYIAATLEAKFNSTNLVSQWLQDRLKELKVQATDADRALQDYKIANNLVNTSKGSLISEQIASLQTQLASARVTMFEIKARLDHIRQLNTEGIANSATVDGSINPGRSDAINFALTNSDLVRLRGQYRILAERASDIESRVGPAHPIIVRLKKQMSEVSASIREEEERIADTYAHEYEIAKAREAELAATLAQHIGEAGTSSQAQVKMRELESSAETLRNLYNNFLQKNKEINTIQTQTIPIENARIVTRAAPQLHKSPRRDAAVLAGGILLGLFFGAGVVIAREWTAGVFRTPKMVEQATDIPCVILPKINPKRERKWLLRRSLPLSEFVLDAPHSRFTESLRNVKASIDSARVEHSAKVIGIVSSVPKEGKTTVAANLAALIIASSGARTLIVDADLHLRLLTAALSPDAREGLIEALEDPSRLGALVCTRDRSGLDVLPCALSTRLSNAAELLGSPKMEQLLAVARRTYDYIIIEIAPIMSVVDVKMIERFIDDFIFVVEWGQTKRAVVLEALSEANIRDRIKGIVLNKADPTVLRTMESYKGNGFRGYYEE